MGLINLRFARECRTCIKCLAMAKLALTLGRRPESLDNGGLLNELLLAIRHWPHHVNLLLCQLEILEAKIHLDHGFRWLLVVLLVDVVSHGIKLGPGLNKQTGR